MAKAAELMADHLAVFIPSAAPALKARAKDISVRLLKLQLTVDERRKAWRTRPVVMFHDVAGYFARRFNLPVLSVSSGAAGHDHSARMIANVARRFKGVSVAAIMVEKDDGAAKSLARELKTAVKIVDFAASREYAKWDDWYLHMVSAWEDVLKS
jgi:ABC-type Zn uptake system ZnuABC Zn-binding protein ZnuA